VTIHNVTNTYYLLHTD